MSGQSKGGKKHTIREAATLLKVHPNTVRNRIKSGIIPAEKVSTERGPTWTIDPDTLINNALPSARQQPVGRVAQLNEEALTFLAREIVREAGLQRDPDEERRDETVKLLFDLFKRGLLC